MNAKVLLVDDEEEFTEILSERMETRGLQVDTANNGFNAIELAAQKSFDAIILDLAMPEMDGIETLRQLLVKNPDLQIILLTGHATLEKGIEAVKLGAVEFLEKPVNIDKLLEKVYEAQMKRIELYEMRAEETLSEIMKRKGW